MHCFWQNTPTYLQGINTLSKTDGVCLRICIKIDKSQDVCASQYVPTVCLAGYDKVACT